MQTSRPNYHNRGQTIFATVESSNESTAATSFAGAKRKPLASKSAAAQAYNEKMAWKDAVSKTKKLTPSETKLEKLELSPLDLGFHGAWEQETTNVLRQITNEAVPNDKHSRTNSKSNPSIDTNISNISSTSNPAPTNTSNPHRLSRLARALSTVSTSSNSSRDTVVDKRASDITIKSNRSSIHGTVPSSSFKAPSLQQRTRRAKLTKSYADSMDHEDNLDESNGTLKNPFRISVDDEDFTKMSVAGLRIPSTELSAIPRPKPVPAIPLPPLVKPNSIPQMARVPSPTMSPLPSSPLSSASASPSSRSARSHSHGHLKAERSMDFSMTSKKSMELNGMRHNHSQSTLHLQSQNHNTRRGLSLTPSALSLRSTTSIASSLTSERDSTSAPKKKSGHSHKLSTTLGHLAKKTSLENVKKFIRTGSTSSFTSGTSPTRNFEISLPTPSDSSREKLSNKLRGSNTLLTLTKGENSNGLTVGVPCKLYDESQLGQLLSLCSAPTVQPFSGFVDEFIKVKSGHFCKLAEASFSEVYLHEPTIGSDDEATIYKIVPFGDEDLGQMPAKDIIQELRIAKMLMTLPGYGYLRQATIVQGQYPQQLLDMWDVFSDENPSENERPDEYKPEQLYCIMAMDDAGVDLEHYELSSWEDGESIFWQTCRILASAELKYQFEHRDLHWGNVVISDVDNRITVTLIDYTLSRALSPTSNTPLYTRMDHPDFFRGKDDYQFDIYRFMRAHVSTISNSNPPNWSTYCPQTNVMWLHYLVDKLLNGKGLVRRKSKSCDTLELLNCVLDPTSSARREQVGPASASFVDFGSANDVLNWGALHHLV